MVKINTARARIQLSSEIPTTSKPYPIPIKLDAAVKKEIITKSYSPYASQAFPIHKRNGSIRLVIEYRKLNSITVKDSYSLPSIESQLWSLKNTKFFPRLTSTLDTIKYQSMQTIENTYPSFYLLDSMSSQDYHSG